MLSRFNIIVAVDEKYGIGKNGSIPWRNAEDLTQFKATTIGEGNNAVIMGRKTYESLPSNMRPLPKRKNVVLTSHKIDAPEGLTICASVPEALKLCTSCKEVYIIGGQRVYDECVRKYAYLCDKIFISHIQGNYNCDTFFPYQELNVLQIETIGEALQTYELQIITVNEHHPEQHYLNLLSKILSQGEIRSDRTKVGTKSIFSQRLEFDLRKGFPLLTTKRTWFKGVLAELLFFISGKTDTKILENQGVNIWKGNTSEKFLADNNLPWREGDMGPCFISDTPVMTISGYKNIQDIVVGEKVYTHMGGWCPVEKTHINTFTGNLITLDVKYHPTLITSTDEHPYYARSFVVKDRYMGMCDVVLMNEPEWVPAKSLTKNHMIGFKIETTERIPQMILRKYGNQNVPDDVIVKSIATYEEWCTLGYFLGDGWLVDEDKGRRIYFEINNNQIDEIFLIISKVLDIKPCENQRGCLKYQCRNSIWAQILVDFVTSAHGKKIPEWVHTAPKDCIKWFLDGYLLADGCYRNNDQNLHRYTTISRDIAYSLQRLYLKLGYIASINFQQSGHKKLLPSRSNLAERKDRLVNQRDVYEINTRLKRPSNCSYIDDGYAWFAISDITIHPVSEVLVYNLTVARDNTYTVCNLSVHNCYGFQWRHAGAEYVGCDAVYVGKGIDQLRNLIVFLKKDPFSRRHIISAWDVANLHMMALPPCHCLMQFYVGCDSNGQPTYLDCCLYQRSADMFLGVPFNIASYGLFMCIIGKITGLIPRRFVHDLGDAHIYSNLIDQAKEQITRSPYPFPKIRFTRDINDIDDVRLEDIVLDDYICHPKLNGEMAV